MKVCVIQPYYSFDEKDTDKCYQDMVALLDKCDESMDLIVLPEYSDIPASQGSKKGFSRFYRKIQSRYYGQSDCSGKTL